MTSDLIHITLLFKGITDENDFSERIICLRYKCFTFNNRCTYLLVLESAKIYIKIHTKTLLHVSVCWPSPGSLYWSLAEVTVVKIFCKIRHYWPCSGQQRHILLNILTIVTLARLNYELPVDGQQTETCRTVLVWILV